MSCSQTFQVELAECCSSIVVDAGLLPNVGYSFLIKDKYNTEYYEYVVTDANGNFVIDCSIFPDGMLNRFMGYLTLEVFQYFPYYYNDGLPCDLTFCNTIYDSVTISFVERHTTKNISIQYITCV